MVSRYADVLMARVAKRAEIESLAAHCSIPVINALDDWAHPMQILADFQTIRETRVAQGLGKSLSGVKLTFVGDLANNVTYDLMRGGALMGMHVRVSGPQEAEYAPLPEVVADTQALAAANGGSVSVVADPREACHDAEFIYGDSIMSYGVDEALRESRMRTFEPWQINADLMRCAAPTAKFMHCLPATRGEEVSADVMDSEASVVFDQAENRLHAQKAAMLFLLGHTHTKGMDFMR